MSVQFDIDCNGYAEGLVCSGYIGNITVHACMHCCFDATVISK